jgi:hypothetical protein
MANRIEDIHTGSSFDDFLIEEGLHEEVESAAIKRDLGQGLHYLQEDHPDMIGREIAVWLKTLQEGRATAQCPPGDDPDFS